jgi:hypothetical protein
MTGLGDVIRAAARCPHTLLTRAYCMDAGSHKLTTQIEREKANIYRKVVIGRLVYVTADSFWAHEIAQAAKPIQKARGGEHLRKPTRPRTPREIEGLRKGNEGRRLEAIERRRAQAQEGAEA